jgi:hypothetical protein
VAPIASPPKYAQQTATRVDPIKIAKGTADAPAPKAADGPLQPARQRILDALAWCEAIGVATPDRAVVAFVADTSSTSSSFTNNLGAMRTAGLIDYPAGGQVALTDLGRDTAQKPPFAMSHEAVVDMVNAKLQPAQRRLLAATVDHYPKALQRDDLAPLAQASATSSSFTNNLGRLRTLGLITYPTRGEVRAADLLFPGGKHGG